MRILYLTHFFQPEPIFWALPLAKELSRKGHQIEVLTGFPNYPAGKLYDGYRIRMLQREVLEGIDVIRVPLYPSHDNSAWRRILCYTSFGLSASLIGPWAAKQADIVYLMQGPMTLGLPALILKLFKRIPFVIHIQDIWPDSLLSTGMFNSKIGLKLLNGWCNFVYKHAAKIITIAPGMKQRLIERGVPENKIEVVYNWCDQAQICPAEKNQELAKSLGMAGRFNVVFAGNMGKAQALEPVLDAAKIVADRQPQVQFVFIGSGVCVEELKQKAADMGLTNVLFLPRRPVSEIGDILNLSDVLFVHLKKDPLFKITIPSKIQSYLAAGRPILVAVPGDASALVQEAQAGLACEPENPQSIADAVCQFSVMSKSELEAMGHRGKQFYQQYLSFEIAAAKIEHILLSQVSRRPNASQQSLAANY
ncbi:MAG TPA: glycosyltransferase family 4 protein [Anaerohalosphaeraceae bacterium]|nr:glycosyltransferase family 4 protein [Anaerohalosphaeraceae bacterium]HPC64119.1 glycosyltransferase family 4 protein [Anaerohalosphaeraceae bacterium]HPO70287.1 glycosyltransferase family 4 protein [Anaerohalosphaeraceae bacterium]HRS71503.1 glycosyltransferase family 4 protein [Anaerohalosphaeraceae bacterium]HRV20436.1 glycosyltransferase family 4 protein [Anaerohalosphaeraceae bacterium]